MLDCHSGICRKSQFGGGTERQVHLAENEGGLQLCHVSHLLSGRLLPQTVAVPALPTLLRHVRRLLPQAIALRPLFPRLLDVRRLLPQTAAFPLLAGSLQSHLCFFLRGLCDVQPRRWDSSAQGRNIR